DKNGSTRIVAFFSLAGFVRTFVDSFVFSFIFRAMSRVGHPYVADYPSDVKSIKYDNFMRNHGWARPHLPRIPGKKETAD
ncbi:hypothetical protein Tco_1564677, partial [Tanacetum coccineum]